MKRSIKEVIKKIKTMATSEEYKNRHKNREKDFTRNRRLPFQNVIYFIPGLVKTSLDFEVLNVCKESGEEKFSAAAISKARDKVNYTAFREMLIKTDEIIPRSAILKDIK